MNAQKSKQIIRMTRDETKIIKKKMIDLEVTQSVMAEELGVRTPSLGAVINGRTTSLNIRNYLAKRLELPELRIIPDYLYLS